MTGPGERGRVTVLPYWADRGGVGAVHVEHLVPGRVVRYQGVSGEDEHAEPQAWSPDGRSVAVLVSTWTDHDGLGPDVRLLLLDAATGANREIAALRAPAALAGWTAAFSPDGSRLAFQNGAAVRVVTLADGGGADVPVPAGARLAGKGAWSRDGANLLVVSGARGDCGTHPVRWTVTEVAAAGDVESLDVPDRVLASGAVRPGDPPMFDMDLITVLVLVLIGAEVSVLLAFAVSWLVARSRRGR